jgi:hypothetical protein
MGASLHVDAVIESGDLESDAEGRLGDYFEGIDGQLFLNVHLLIKIQLGALQEVLGSLGVLSAHEGVFIIG